ncbi:MAG: DNA topoisomerase IV subunit B [Alphaproteobacteria bacterium]|nr:DNA topoisomerase IV subunit B [Alphaproteobacteria bacterium]MBR3914056.1 DNA topoisomerase IV subunit B [Alphaproteobacteria bacterium]
MSDLFNATPVKNEYSAKDIEVLEGLDPVRKRPGMYIGGIDERAYHHLVAEIIDNAMDEAVAGYATNIEVYLNADGYITVKDNGRGIPVDPHPKFPDKSALEVITTTLHSGGKFGGDAYAVSGGLHGVGLSAVNALSAHMIIEVARDKKLYRQEYRQGHPQTPVEFVGPVSNRRGTSVSFIPDTEIFGETVRFKPSTLFRMARTKAFLFRGVEIRWSCEPSLIGPDDKTPTEQILKFPNGVADFLDYLMQGRTAVTPKPFSGRVELPDNEGAVEWAICWPDDFKDGFSYSYCNTVVTPLGGTHETGLRAGLTKSLRAFADMSGNKKAADITADDILSTAGVMLSVFIKDPQFQGQTKEKLVTQSAARLVENAVKDPFDHWLSRDIKSANALLEFIIERAEERKRKKKTLETARASATKKLRLPGKLADCSHKETSGTEIFLVEGDSAGGSAKQARDRMRQAILPLRGKILNVISASNDKILANEEIRDMTEALGCGRRDKYNEDGLRYEKIIIMTDADVDGAHIASLLMSFFYQEMPKLIENGHLYIALPPLYRLTQGGKSVYAADDEEKERLLKTVFKNAKNVDISRFKGLGEMPPAQLKETTMDPAKRTLLRVSVPRKSTEEDAEECAYTAQMVERLMGTKPEYRFQFIQEHAKFVENLDI